MQESKKSWLIIGSCVVVIILAGFAVFKSLSGGKDVSGAGVKIPLICANCNQVKLSSVEELQELAKENAPADEQGSPLGVGGIMGASWVIETLSCPKCGQMALQQAIECPNCGEIYPVGLSSPACPKCNMTQLEAMSKKRGKK